MLKYQIVLWWSEKDGAYLAMMPQIPGCIADGDTPEKAIEAAREVAEICLDFAREEGHVLPEPSGAFVPVSHQFDWQSWPAARETVAVSPQPTTQKSIPRTVRASKKSHVHV